MSYRPRGISVDVNTSSSLNIDGTHEAILSDATSANQELTLPLASSSGGFKFFIKKTDSSANTVTVIAQASENVDGWDGVILSAQGDKLWVASDGSSWHSIISDGTEYTATPASANDLTVANSGSTAYDKTYTPMTNDFFIDADYFGIAGVINTTTGGYHSYKYHTGSVWYVVAYNTVDSEWGIFSTSTDPETLADDSNINYGSSADRNPSFCGTTETFESDLRPAESHANVSYS